MTTHRKFRDLALGGGMVTVLLALAGWAARDYSLVVLLGFLALFAAAVAAAIWRGKEFRQTRPTDHADQSDRSDQ